MALTHDVFGNMTPEMDDEDATLAHSSPSPAGHALRPLAMSSLVNFAVGRCSSMILCVRSDSPSVLCVSIEHYRPIFNRI